MPNCAKCGTKLEYQGGHMVLNIGGRYARGHRNWKCSLCGARPNEPVAYDYDNDVLLVNLKEGQVLEGE
jgi:hypothetical protein